MKISISDARINLCKIIQSLIDGKEETVVITKNGKPVVQMTFIEKNSSKRIGIAKEEMKDFDISLEEFNSIPTSDFGL